MSVVFHRSTGKMILKSLVAIFVFSLAWIKSVAGGTSYSNVYVQSGPSLSSLYGPVGYRGAQLAPLAAAPLMSSLLPPCVSPCVIPSQQVAAIAPVATSSANFVSYNSPVSVPVVVAPTNDEGANYQYSYVVYDENTGDQKAQKESSDGGVVRGQYSLIQPDGYVREVQYTADDISGFNAVVKNFLPNFELKEKISPPCPEIKKEPIKESPKSESHDLEPDAHGEESHEEHGHGEETHEGHDPGESEGHGHEDHGEQGSHEEPKAQEEHGHEEHEGSGSHEEHKDHEEPEGHEEQSHGESATHEEHGHGEPESQVNGEHGKQEDHAEHGESESHEGPAKHGEPEGNSHEEHAEHGESESQEEPPKHGESEGHEEHAKHEEHKEPESHEGSHEEPRADHLFEENSGETNVLVSYNDIIKCIQAAIKGQVPQPTSPLTYIVLNKPC